MRRPTVLVLTTALLLTACGGPGEPASSTDCVPPVIGHRGEPAVAPEETIASFTAAIDDGATTIEGDVHFTRDGHPVMLHDDTLDRTTDGRGRVSSKTIAQVESLDAGGWMGNEWKGDRVPTLTAFLQLASSRHVDVIVELKQAGASRAQVRTFLSDLKKAGMADRTLVESFHADNLGTVRALNPSIRTALITTTPVPPKKAKSLGDALLPKLSITTPARVRAWQAAGVKVYPWTADNPEQWAKAAKAKVDGVLTNSTTDYLQWAAQQCSSR